MQKVEHSAESLLLFIQHYYRGVEIFPILVPAMNSDRMDEIAGSLAAAIHQLMTKNQQKWGQDLAILLTLDAVYYGDEDRGGKNMFPFGADSAGNVKTMGRERAPIDSCLVEQVFKIFFCFGESQVDKSDQDTNEFFRTRKGGRFQPVLLNHLFDAFHHNCLILRKSKAFRGISQELNIRTASVAFIFA